MRPMKIYCTTYCNKGHDIATGKPVDHECYVIPPKALEAEMQDDIPKALELIDLAKLRGRFRPHKGVKAPTQYEVIVDNIGTVYSGENGFTAYNTYFKYVGIVADPDKHGTRAGDSVVLMRDGDIAEEYMKGENEDNNDDESI